MTLKPSKKSVSSLVSKATRDRAIKPPKEKYVNSLCLSTFGGPMAIKELTASLTKRLEKTSWVEGEQMFIQELTVYSTKIFSLKSSNVYLQNNLSSLLVKKYARYIEEQIYLKDYFTRVFKLQSQFNALLNCRVVRQHYILNNPLLSHLYILLSKDTIILYPMLTKAVMNLVDKCFGMKKRDAEKILEVYMLFIKESNSLVSFYSMVKPLVPHLPAIQIPKQEIVQSIAAYISKAPVDDEPPVQYNYYEERTLIDNMNYMQNSYSKDLFSLPNEGNNGIINNDDSTSSESIGGGVNGIIGSENFQQPYDNNYANSINNNNSLLINMPNNFASVDGTGSDGHAFMQTVNQQSTLLNYPQNNHSLIGDIDHYGVTFSSNQTMNPNGQVVNPNGQIMNPNGPVVNPNGPIMNPNGQIMNPNGPIMNPNGPIMNPNGPVVNPNSQSVGPIQNPNVAYNMISNMGMSGTAIGNFNNVPLAPDMNDVKSNAVSFNPSTFGGGGLTYVTPKTSSSIPYYDIVEDHGRGSMRYKSDARNKHKSSTANSYNYQQFNQNKYNRLL